MNRPKTLQTIVVKITQVDIDAGQRCSTSSCPVALAMKRKLGVNTISVTQDRVYVTESCRVFDTSDKIVRFINAFDDKRPVKPFVTRLKEITK